MFEAPIVGIRHKQDVQVGSDVTLSPCLGAEKHDINDMPRLLHEHTLEKSFQGLTFMGIEEAVEALTHSHPSCCSISRACSM